MDSTGAQSTFKSEDEGARLLKRAALREANLNPRIQGQHYNYEWAILGPELGPLDTSKDSSLKRHTALIKRIRQSLAVEGRDQILKEIDLLSLGKYIDEIVGAVVEGISRCKTERDVWAAVEVGLNGILCTISFLMRKGQIISSLHQRFPTTFTPALLLVLSSAISPPNRAVLNTLTSEQREREESSRVIRQRPVVRVCSELALVGIIKDGPGRSGGEWMMKAMRELVRPCQISMRSLCKHYF